jgi:hypothetical protein
MEGSSDAAIARTSDGNKCLLEAASAVEVVALSWRWDETTSGEKLPLVGDEASLALAVSRDSPWFPRRSGPHDA